MCYLTEGGIHMDVNFIQKRNTLIVNLSGELDHHSASEIKNLIDDQLSHGSINNCMLDCKDLQFMDSSGVGLIIGRYKKIKALNGQIVAINVNPQIKRIFTISGLDRIITIYPDLKTALKNI